MAQGTQNGRILMGEREDHDYEWEREHWAFLHPERKGMSTMKGQSEEVDGLLYLIFSLPYNLPEIQPLAKPVWLDPSILLTGKP